MANSNWEKALSILDPLILGPLYSSYSQSEDIQKREAAIGEAPTFEIPESYDRYQAMMKERTQQQMPGYDIMEQDIKQQTAADVTGVQQLMSGPDAIMGTNSLYADQSSRLQDLGMRASQWQQEQQMGYMGAIQGRSQYETQQYEYNKWMPWQIAKNEIASLRGAGQQAMASGMDSTAAAGVMMVGNIMNETK